MKNKAFKIAAASVAGVVLGGALIYYNFIDTTTVPIVEVGDKAPDFTVTTYKVADGEFEVGGDNFTMSDHLDKILVVNFWATYCGPCKAELPEFDQFQKEYADDVTVIALDGELDYSYESLCTWLNTQEDAEGWEEFSFTFGRFESQGNNVLQSFGFTGALPATVIIDYDGVIRFKKQGSMHYADLEKEVLPLIQ